MKVLIAAGGTGGHIFPAIAVAQALRKKNPAVEILCVGIGRKVERDIYAKFGFDYKVLPFVPLTGKGIAGFLKLVFVFPVSFLRALALFFKYKPNVVIAFGGYPSFLPVITAWLLRIPCLLQEQNVQVGMANRLLSRFVRKVFAVPGASGFAKSVNVQELSNPVREEFSHISQWKEPSENEHLNLLVLGGSQGAQSLNSAVIELAELLYQFGISLTHQVGAQDFERVSKAYTEIGYEQLQCQAFIDDMPAALSRAHLVISRAGAMSVAEVSAACRPAIYVPLPIAAGHQERNVEFVCSKHAAFVVRQDQGFSDVLAKVVLKCVTDLGVLKEMAESLRKIGFTAGRASAADIIAGEIERACVPRK